MKPKIICIILLFMQSVITAQSYRDGIVQTAYSSGHSAPHYAYVRDADIMWARRIWREVDFREKLNQYLLFPLTENNNRVNLITVLQNGIRSGDIIPFDPIMGDDFKVIMNSEDALMIGSGVDTVPIYDHKPPYDHLRDTVIARPFDGFSVRKLRIKEDWFFDMKRSVMEVRIVGICPVIEVMDPVSGEVRGEREMFWINFEQARNYLATCRIYNPYNNGQRISYDDAFNKRIFSSLIYKKDNVMDRGIRDYQQGIDALLEAEDIKNDMMVFEHDLWEQ